MDKIKDLCKSKPWLMYIAIAVIIAGSALQVFIDFGTVLKVILAVIVFLSFIVLGAFLMLGEGGANKTDKMNLSALRARRRASKVTEDIMTITYAAVVVLGTFCDSILVILIGIMLFVMHTFLSAATRRHFKKMYKDK